MILKKGELQSNSFFFFATSYQKVAVSYQLSAVRIGYQLPATSFQKVDMCEAEIF